MKKRSEIIKSSTNKDSVQLGSTVEVEINKKRKIFKILGSTETNPDKGIISHNSPIGKALIRKKVGVKCGMVSAIWVSSRTGKEK